jgi:YggT family protein
MEGSMYVTNNILPVLGQLLHVLLTVYLWIVIIGALISWINPDPYNPIVRFLRNATDPVFSWLRRNFPLIIGGIDLSPIVVIALIIFFDIAMVKSLAEQGNILPNILIGLGQSIYVLLNFYMWIVIIAAVTTFVNPNPYNPIVRFLHAVTSPVFAWFRRRLPLRIGGFDFSPAVVIIIIIIINMVVTKSLITTGIRLKLQGGL